METNDIKSNGLFYDCHHCKGLGCDTCGGTGIGTHAVSKVDTNRFINKMAVADTKYHLRELTFKDGDFRI